MTAAEPPDETDGTQTNSPWRRPPPGWTLFDATGEKGRRDEAEPDGAANGNTAPPSLSTATPVETTSDAGARDAVLAHAPWPPATAGISTAAVTPTVVVPPVAAPDGASVDATDDDACAEQPPAAPGHADADEPAAAGAPSAPTALPMVTAEVPEGDGHLGTTGPVAPPASDDVALDAKAIAIALTIAAIMAETAPADGGAPTALSAAADSGVAHAAGPVLAAAPALEAGTDAAAAPAVTPVAVAPEPHRRAQHAKRATRTTRVWRAIGLVVLAAVLACVGIGVYALVEGSWAINPILSGSMRPGFAVGGVVISERVPVDQLALRDVIVFQDPLAPSQQIVHRIVGIAVARGGQRTFFTQGDANASRDPWQLRIPGSTVYRVRWSVPLLGYVAVAYENHRGIALIVAGALLVLVAVPTIAQARRRKRPAEPPAG